MDILGQPDDLKATVDKSDSDVVRPQLGDNKLRFLFGPVRSKKVFYPSIYIDNTTKEVKQIRHAVQVPESGSVFDELAAVDKTIRAGLGDQKPRSVFNPSLTFLYLGFNRAETAVTVRVVEVKKTVAEALIKLEEARSTKDASKLRYGPIYTWDAIVTKTQDPSLPKQTGTKYKTEVDPESCPLMGQIPAEWLKDPVQTFFSKVDKSKVFTEEELKAIKEAEIDLRAATKPLTGDELVNELREYPIDMNAKNEDGSMVFPDPPTFAKKLKELGMKFIEPGASPVVMIPEQAGGVAPKTFVEETSLPGVGPVGSGEVVHETPKVDISNMSPEVLQMLAEQLKAKVTPEAPAALAPKTPQSPDKKMPNW